jgi:hypothetical protein
MMMNTGAHEYCIAIVDDDESMREAATNLSRSTTLTPNAGHRPTDNP